MTGHRPPASTALWAHLLRTDISALPSSQVNSTPYTSVVPKDKNGTSMRLLLLDASNNLEQFSTRVDQLISGVDQAKIEILALHKKFQNEQVELTTSIREVVNRCQTEVQKSMGSPAQQNQMKDMHKDLQAIDRRFETLDKRLDLLHTLYQSQNEAFQAQTKVLQSQVEAFRVLQSQQSNMVSMLSPLLPLLQAIPLHIEIARNNITASLLKATHIAASPDTAKRPGLTQRSPGHELEEKARSSSTLAAMSSSDLSPSRKRARLDADLDSPETDPTEPRRRRSKSVLSTAPLQSHPGSVNGELQMAGKKSFLPAQNIPEPRPRQQKQLNLRPPSSHPSDKRNAIDPIQTSCESVPPNVMRHKSISSREASVDVHSRSGWFTVSSKQRESEDSSRSLRLPSSTTVASSAVDHSTAFRTGTPRKGKLPHSASINAIGLESSVKTGRTTLGDTTPNATGCPSHAGITRALSHWQVERPQQYLNRTVSKKSNHLRLNPTSNVANKPMSIKDRNACRVHAQGMPVKQGKRFLRLDEDEDDENDEIDIF